VLDEPARMLFTKYIAIVESSVYDWLAFRHLNPVDGAMASTGLYPIVVRFPFVVRSQRDFSFFTKTNAILNKLSRCSSVIVNVQLESTGKNSFSDGLNLHRVSNGWNVCQGAFYFPTFENTSTRYVSSVENFIPFCGFVDYAMGHLRGILSCFSCFFSGLETKTNKFQLTQENNNLHAAHDDQENRRSCHAGVGMSPRKYIE